MSDTPKNVESATKSVTADFDRGPEPPFLTHAPLDWLLEGNGDDLVSKAFDAGTRWQEWQDAKLIAGVLAANAPVTASTVEDLDALPVESVIRWREDCGEHVARKPEPSRYPRAVDGFWELIGSELGTTSEDIFDDARGRITVLHVPKREATR